MSIIQANLFICDLGGGIRDVRVMEVPLLSNFECSFLVLLGDVSHSCVIKCVVDYYHDR